MTVTRTKERLYAPPRSAVRVPGTKSAFLSNWKGWTGQDEIVIGCFLLVFMSIGTGIFAAGLAGTVGPWTEGFKDNAPPETFLGMMGFGAVFFLVALRMLQIVAAGVSRKPAKRKRKQLEPWTWDHPWSKEWMKPDYTGGGNGTILGRVALLALFGFFNLAWGSPSWLLKGVVVLLDLFALLILYDSLQKLAQWLRFRHPVVIWSTLPAFLGERLAGRIAFARPVRASGSPVLTLRCVRDEGVESHQFEAFSIYRDVREIPVPANEPLDALDFEFEVPRDLPGTDLAADHATYWQVVVDVPLAGPNLETVFLAPVYKKHPSRG